MPTFRQIIGNSVKIKFEFAEEEIQLEFHPGRVTEKTLKIFHAVENVKEESMFDDIESFNRELAGIIKWWNVTEDDGETMYPLEVKRLADLPLMFRGAVASAILRNFSPEARASQEKTPN